MHSRQFIIICVFIALLGCTKESFNIQLSTPSERNSVAVGRITDSYEKQVFTLTWSQKLGEKNPIYIANAAFSVTGPEGIYSFTEIGPGTYESNVPFKGEYGENYHISYISEGKTHEIDTKMPEPIEITSLHFENLDSSALTNFYVNFAANSPAKQYLRYKLFTSHVPVEGEDTVWQETSIPIYRVIMLPAGENSISIPYNWEDYTNIVSGTLMRLELEVITEKVGDYLLNLENYSTNATEEGKALNPPFYYSNEAYGLGYGAIPMRIIHQF